MLPPFRLYQPKPVHPDWRDLRREALTLAARIARRVQLQPSARARTIFIRRRLRAIARTVKNLFRNKIRLARGNHDFVPLFYIWTMTNACNFNCTYCSNHRGTTYPALWREGPRDQLTTARGKQLIDVMRESSAIYFCGGEPTLRKDLPELLAHATRRHMFNMINTNGSLLGDLLLKPGYEDFLRQMDVIIVSLDALTIPRLADMYRVGEPVARKVLRNLLVLRVLQNWVPFKLSANTVITRDTIEESFDILDLCNDLDIAFSPVSANIGHEPDWELVRDPRYRALVAKILARARQGYPMIASPAMLESLLLVQGFQCYPTVFDHVDHDGRTFWPCKAYPGAAKVPVLAHGSVQAVHAAASAIIDPYRFHGQGAGQCGGNCAWMQNCVTHTYGRALREGLFGSGILREIMGVI